MQIFRYWDRVDVDAEGREVPGPGITGASGWSDENPQAARRLALERAKAFARWLREDPGRLRDRYAYLDRPVREPILDEMHLDGQRVAALTRNGYGAVVLNAAKVFIADIDRPSLPLGQSLKSLWNRLRGRSVPSAEQEVLERVARIVSEHRGLGVRLYRTRAGHRAIVTTRTIPPATEESRRLLDAFESDPLYMRLCEHQKCYRARLTPKPWRIDLAVPSVQPFPRTDEASERKLAEWVTTYEAAANEWAACEPLETLGDDAVHAAVAPVLKWHDTRACAAGRPLA